MDSCNKSGESPSATYFDSFGVEHMPKEILKIHKKQNYHKSIYRIQTFNSIMCGYLCIGFIGFMIKEKGLLDYND